MDSCAKRQVNGGEIMPQLIDLGPAPKRTESQKKPGLIDLGPAPTPIMEAIKGIEPSIKETKDVWPGMPGTPNFIAPMPETSRGGITKPLTTFRRGKIETAERPPISEAPKIRAAPPVGYRKPPKPTGWEYASLIEKITLGISESKANYLLERFGKQLTNAFAHVGETLISHPLSPVGIPEREAQKYKEQAYKELDVSGFKGSAAEVEQLVRSRAAQLAAAKRIPKFKTRPPAEVSERVTDVAAGLTAFIAQLALTKKILPKGTPDPVIWEIQNQATGGIPGQGAAIRLTLGQIGRIPTGTLPGKLGKVGLESGLFASYTAALGGNAENIIISGLIPVAFNAWSFAKQRHHITRYERNLKSQALKKHQQRIQQGMNPATSEAYLKADMRVVNDAVGKAKQTIYRDDAFAPAKQRWEAQRKKALAMIASGKPDAVKKGNAILDFMKTRGEVISEPLIEMPTTRTGEVREAVTKAAKVVRHPVKAARKAVAGRLPAVNVPTAPKVVTPPPTVGKLAPEKPTEAITKPEAVEVAPEAKPPEEIAKSLGVPIKIIPKGLRAKAQYRKQTDDIAIRSHLPKGFDRDAAIAHELGHRAHTNISNEDMDVFNKLAYEFRDDINKLVGRNINYFEEKGDYHGYFESFAELYGRYILGKELPNNQFKFYFDEVTPLPQKALAKAPAEPTTKEALKKPSKVMIPESEEEWTKRSRKFKKELEKDIESIDIYQDEIRAQGERAEEFQVGRIFFEKKYKGEVTEAIENHPSLRLHITYDKTKGAPWDGIIQERLGRYLEGIEATGAYMDVSEFLERVAEVTEHRKKIGKLNIRAIDVLADSGDIYFETLAAKYDMILQGFTAEEINENVREIALDHPDVPSDYVEKLLIPIVEGEPSVEEKQRMVEEMEAKARPLRRKIHAVAAKKGLTKKALEDLKKKHAGYRYLTGKISKAKITTEQLENLLQAVQKARPKQVGYKKVITRKTEKKIQSLKDNLINKTQMTERHFKDILEKEVHGKEPKYIDAKKFITETEGKDILRRMLDTAEIVRLTESYDQAIAKNDEISKQVKSLNSRIGKAPKRDPYSLESMRYYNQQAEILTGAPIFTSYMDLIDTHLEITKTRTATWKRLEKTTAKFKEIAKNEESLQRVSDYIASQSTLKEKPQMPKGITDAETKLAKEIQKILEEYRLKVRVAKFYNWYYYNQPIPDHDRYKREITKAVDIYESKGKEELIEYLGTQEWGIVKSGYEPLEILFHKIRPYTTGPTAVGKGHIKIRTDIEYHRQERNILQRLSAYMRQVDMLYNLSPKINAYVRLFDDNASKFKEWGKVKNDIQIFLRNLKRYNIEGGFFERMIARAYSQAMRTIIMPSPVLSILRNLIIGQNPAFEHDKTILFNPKNKNLSDGRIEYLETYVQQVRGMVEEYFMLGEKPLPGLKLLTKLVDKVKLYPWSDTTNRHWNFWAKTNQVDRALKAGTIKQMMTKAKFEDMKELEQRRALAILARDGKEAMIQYVGRVHVDDIHFLYERAQRSPAEMTSLGKVVGNLMLFPRAYTEKLAHAANKMLRGKTYQERYRGFKILSSVIIGGLIVGSLYRKVTGRKRNPYDPLELFSYEVGGLSWGAIEAVNDVYSNMLLAISGDDRALAALTTAIPESADMFVPFYDYTLRGYEALTDQKNVDRKALRKMRMMIDKEYEIRGGAYKVRRNALQKWQYFLAGAGVDEEIQRTGLDKRAGVRKKRMEREKKMLGK